MKKVLSIILVAIMLFTMVPASVFAAEAPSVKLVSFMRGDVTDLRSSELLEVQVEGYEGNPRELTYKWTSSLGTYLYIYNSHNMYGINNTYGEYEIYNSRKDISRSKNVDADRAGDQTLTKEGFMWAAVYGAYSSRNASTALKGEVKVEVFDKNGKSLGSDSFSSFKTHNLDADIDNVVIGLFIGEEVNALDLLGRSGVVHITCTESSVTKAVLTKDSQKNVILINTKDGDYYITGKSAGQVQIDISIEKNNCKFHYETSGSATPLVYVFKKPTTTTTTTTLIINKDSVDDRCEYFIDGNKGAKQPDGTVIFTGLTPNTEYTVEARAEYQENGATKYIYSYVDDTTKPVYSAKIYTYLDGALTDFENIYGSGAELFIREDNPYTEYISLGKKSTGIYEAPLYNAVFYAWHKINDTYNKASDYELIIENANAELHLHNYSVKYNTNGGAFKAGEEVGTEIYASGKSVNVTSNVPVREGFIFTGWEYDGKTIASGNQVTASISSPITLKAKWEKAVNVTINVTIDHKTVDGFDPNPTRADLDVDFLEMTANSPAFVETGDKLNFRQDKVTDENGNTKAYTYSVENNVSTYTATDYTYTGLLESSTFGVALSKSGYDVGTIEKKQDKSGNWVINVPLTYNPDDFDLDFSIEMAEDVPEELYPDAVIVKIAYWNTETNKWKIISQQETTDVVVKPGVRVDINKETGKGEGSYPVWRYDGSNNAYGYRAVVTGFVYGDSVITVPDEIIEGKIAVKTYTDGNYTATMGDVADGQKYGELYGAYYDGVDQQGKLHGIISVEKYDVIFDANGGEIKGNDTFTEEGEYYVPDTKNYVPANGEHEFLGWYKDPEFKEPAVSGELLKKDITLYAKWDQILTGYVRVAGSYMQDGKVVDVWSVDRAESAVVILQEITESGIYNIDRKTVNIVWPKSEMVYGISEEYKFTDLDPTKQYRTEILVLNYGTTYQNSTTSFVLDENYADDYNANDYKAIYPADSKWETFVNAYLSFEPASYFQPVEVDATLIGANSRPENTLVQVWYKATGTDNAYQVISQHTVHPYGIEVTMGTDGMDDGNYGYTVWNSVYNGALYDYQAYLDKIEGEEVSTWPVSVVYGSPSRYSPINDAPTGTLQVKLVPNRYNIVYNENYADEGVNVVSHGTHIWSYETVIDYVPVRDGYVFDGWYSNPECTGEKVTVIDETVAANTNLYAKWQKRTDLELTVKHMVKDTDVVLKEEIKTALTFDAVITAESLKKDFKGYVYDSASAESVTIGTNDNVITLWYTPNMYGYTVNYLEDGTNKVLADAKKSTAAYDSTIKEYPISIFGYEIVNDMPIEIKIDTDNNVINFYYTKKNIEYKVNYLEEGTNKTLKPQKKASAEYGSEVTETAIIINGYAPVGDAEKSITIDAEGRFINFYYAVDVYGSNDDNGNKGDGTPDKYQKKVIFEVINGTWSDKSDKNVIVYVTLTTDNKWDVNGTADITVPEGMLPDEGYENGGWKVTPPSKVSGTDTVKYTYTFSKIVIPEEPEDPNTPVNPDTPADPDTPAGPDTPVDPDTPANPDGDGSGNGSADIGHYIVFGKTNSIGWYNVSLDGGETYQIVFGNSTLEVAEGTEMIIKAGDLVGGAFTFYVNGNAVKPDENNAIKITVDGYMLIGALALEVEVPDVEESLNWFQKLIKAIKDFFAKLFGKK